MNSVECLVIGAGVVGLAIARAHEDRRWVRQDAEKPVDLYHADRVTRSMHGLD